ncbi:uncharacterized protein LOC131931297 [Physella acuta]|uniref:uncharacterized protein LOC131931297 n=1 Tax=Physella acuta TaxID=109671 RepID=UPI0027DBDFBE|nr:uncharacterized protein LOC131931297 [Physella acuta]
MSQELGGEIPIVLLILVAVVVVVALLYKFFTSGSSPEFGNESRTSSDWLDLHGYSVHSAIRILEDFINRKQRENGSMIHVVTGQGLHSPSYGPVIKPAVMQYLNNSGYRCRWSDDGGSVTVFLR